MEQGFVIKRRAFDPSELVIPPDAIDYTTITPFVNKMLTQLKMPPAAKYRVSNGTNSVDAGTFHRDLIIGDGVWRDVRTCILYANDTTMEVIPGTHRRLDMCFLESMLSYKPIRLQMRAGDVLIIYATLIHRGVFTGGERYRGVLQIFDCTNDPITHVHSRLERYGALMIWTSKTGPLVAFLNLFSYLNAAFGYNATAFECNVPAAYSSEGLSERLKVTGGLQPLNKYIYLASKFVDLPEDCFATWYYTLYTRNYVFFALVIFMITVAGIWLWRR